MEELLVKADRLLALLPFNANKTLIGAALKLLLPVAVLKFPPLLVAAPVLDGLAELLIGAGLVHKGVKAVVARHKEAKE